MATDTFPGLQKILLPQRYFATNFVVWQSQPP